MDDHSHLPLAYSQAIAQAEHDADAISSLDVLVKLNQLTKEQLHNQRTLEISNQLTKERLHNQRALEISMARQQLQELLVARQVDAVSMGSEQGSLFAQQSILPPSSSDLLFNREWNGSRDEFSPILSSKMSPERMESHLLHRTAPLSDKPAQFAATKASKSKRLVVNASADKEQGGGIPSVPSAEKVKAALESRPQRGRKRADLSVEERMQLNKTRNREHARNTRYVHYATMNPVGNSSYR